MAASSDLPIRGSFAVRERDAAGRWSWGIAVGYIRLILSCLDQMPSGHSAADTQLVRGGPGESSIWSLKVA